MKRRSIMENLRSVLTQLLKIKHMPPAQDVHDFHCEAIYHPNTKQVEVRVTMKVDECSLEKLRV